MTDHDRFRELSAGYLLGALEPGERREFEAHLASCSACQAEVAAIAPIPGLLAKSEYVAAEALPTAVADRAVAQARSEWIDLAASRRRWRWTAGIAAVLAAVMTIVAVLPQGDAPQEPTSVLAVDSLTATGQVLLHSRGWGTALRLELDGLPQRTSYVAWVVDAAGNRQQVAVWGPTSSGRANLDGASSIATSDVAAVLVTDGDGVETLLAASS